MPQSMAAVQALAFRIRCDAFPYGDWAQFTSEIGARRCKRRSGDQLRWFRVVGRGYQVWLTDVILVDSASHPPAWEIRLQALSNLNTAGQKAWNEIVAGLKRWSDRLGLEYSTS